MPPFLAFYQGAVTPESYKRLTLRELRAMSQYILEVAAEQERATRELQEAGKRR